MFPALIKCFSLFFWKMQKPTKVNVRHIWISPFPLSFSKQILQKHLSSTSVTSMCSTDCSQFTHLTYKSSCIWSHQACWLCEGKINSLATCQTLSVIEISLLAKNCNKLWGWLKYSATPPPQTIPPCNYLAGPKANTVFLGLSPRCGYAFQPRSPINFPGTDSSVVQIWVKALRVLLYSPLFFSPWPLAKGL